MSPDVKLELLFKAVGALSPPVDLGPGPQGARRMVPILAGPFEGPRIRGQILPGGVDWQFTRPDGVIQLEAHYRLETEDGIIIRVTNRGYRHAPPEVMQRLAAGLPVDPSEYYFRASPVFEAPHGRYDWLNRSIFICTAERYPESVVLYFYQVL